MVGGKVIAEGVAEGEGHDDVVELGGEDCPLVIEVEGDEGVGEVVADGQCEFEMFGRQVGKGELLFAGGKSRAQVYAVGVGVGFTGCELGGGCGVGNGDGYIGGGVVELLGVAGVEGVHVAIEQMWSDGESLGRCVLQYFGLVWEVRTGGEGVGGEGGIAVVEDFGFEGLSGDHGDEVTSVVGGFKGCSKGSIMDGVVDLPWQIGEGSAVIVDDAEIQHCAMEGYEYSPVPCLPNFGDVEGLVGGELSCALIDPTNGIFVEHIEGQLFGEGALPERGYG